MTKEAPAFPLYAERWFHGTRLMSKIERSDYMDLLCHQWTSDGLPGDLSLVARILGYRSASQIPDAVTDKFPLCHDGKRRNARLEEERSKQRDFRRTAHERAQKAAGARWKKSPQAAGDVKKMAPTLSRDSDPASQKNPTLAEVRQWALSIMAPEECAVCFYNDHEARPLTEDGFWTSRDLVPVRNARSAFTSFATRWKSNDQQRKTKTNEKHRANTTRSDTLNAPGRYA